MILRTVLLIFAVWAKVNADLPATEGNCLNLKRSSPFSNLLFVPFQEQYHYMKQPEEVVLQW